MIRNFSKLSFLKRGLVASALLLMCDQTSFAFQCNPDFFRNSLVYVANTATAWVQGKVIEKSEQKLPEASPSIFSSNESSLVESTYTVAIDKFLFGSMQGQGFQFKTNNRILGAERQFKRDQTYLFFVLNNVPEVGVCIPVPEADSQEALELKKKLLYEDLLEKAFLKKIKALQQLQKNNAYEQAEALALTFRGPKSLDWLRVQESIQIERKLGRFALAAELVEILPDAEKNKPETLMLQAEDFAKSGDFIKTYSTLNKIAELKLMKAQTKSIYDRLKKNPAFHQFSGEENRKISDLIKKLGRNSKDI